MKKDEKMSKETEELIKQRVKKELDKERQVQERKEQLNKLTPAQKQANNDFITKMSKKALKIVGIIAAIVMGGGTLVAVILYIISICLVL